MPCLTGKYVLQLTTAHVTGGNVEIIQPLKLTSTHVIVDVRRFSLVGLLKALLFQAYPIRAQVLLFCEETGKHRMSKLHIHLLPGNVPVEEVISVNEYVYYYVSRILIYSDEKRLYCNSRLTVAMNTNLSQNWSFKKKKIVQMHCSFALKGAEAT